MKRVEVEWRDSMGQGGWHRREDLERDIAADDYLDCCSVGYLFAETERSITLVQNQNPAQVGEAMTIPREAVARIVELRRKGTVGAGRPGRPANG